MSPAAAPRRPDGAGAAPTSAGAYGRQIGDRPSDGIRLLEIEQAAAGLRRQLFGDGPHAGPGDAEAGEQREGDAPQLGRSFGIA